MEETKKCVGEIVDAIRRDPLESNRDKQVAILIGVVVNNLADAIGALMAAQERQAAALERLAGQFEEAMTLGVPTRHL